MDSRGQQAALKRARPAREQMIALPSICLAHLQHSILTMKADVDYSRSVTEMSMIMTYQI